MNLTIPYDYIEDRSHIVWTQTLAEVVRVERSSTGFKTNTGTTRPCFECRDQTPIGGSGVEPFPIATWLLHAEVFGTRTKIQLPLCSDHFKELRDEERNTRQVGESGPWELGPSDLLGLREGKYRVSTPEWDSPWLDKAEVLGVWDPDLEPLSDPYDDPLPRA